jgi:hypothetical protein
VSTTTTPPRCTKPFSLTPRHWSSRQNKEVAL